MLTQRKQLSLSPCRRGKNIPPKPVNQASPLLAFRIENISHHFPKKLTALSEITQAAYLEYWQLLSAANNQVREDHSAREQEPPFPSKIMKY